MKTAGAEVIPSLRALLVGSVDYAGLFPPAALALEPALDNYAAYLRGEEAWMLGCFVLPVAQLAETGPLLAGRFDSEHPLRVSALGAKTASADEFLGSLRGTLQSLADFRMECGTAVAVEQLEAPLPTDAEPGPALDSLLLEAARVIAEARGFNETLRIFWEIPFSDHLPAMLLEIAEHNAWVSGSSAAAASPHSSVLLRCLPFGAKLRTGGTEAGAFPSSVQLARALIAARDTGVALKFTAGLHHPFRRFDAGVTAWMHGFINVFTAGVFIRHKRLDAASAQTVLEDEDAAGFRFDAAGLQWHTSWRVTAEAVVETRKFITSFGSCSFDEPRDDLRAAGLLP